MPNQKNLNQLEEITAALKNSQAVVLTNYSGLHVADQISLQADVAKSGAQYRVFKNTLLKLALKDVFGDLSEDTLKALEGQTAVLISTSDPISPIKTLMNFYKAHELPQIKMGFMRATSSLGEVWDGNTLSAQDIDSLSKLPGREQLLGQLVRQLNAPISSFAQVLRANLQNLVFVVDAVRISKTN